MLRKFHELAELETKVENNLSKLCLQFLNEELEDIERKKLRAEHIAFNFYSFHRRNTISKNLFSSSTEWKFKKDFGYEKQVLKINTWLLDYWLERFNSSINPLLKARYGGLVFDFGTNTSSYNIPPVLGEGYIIALIKMVNLGNQNQLELMTKSITAFRSSEFLKNVNLIDKSIICMIEFEESINNNANCGLYGFCYDFLVKKNHPRINELLEKRIINLLEKREREIIENKDFDQNAYESVIERLGSYYKAKGLMTKVKNLLDNLGSRMELENLNPAQKVHQLELILKKYLKYGFSDQSKTVLAEIRRIDKEIPSQMVKVQTKFTVSVDDIDKELEMYEKLDVEEGSKKLISSFLPQHKDILNFIKEEYSKNPIQGLFTRSLHDKKGRKTAVVNSFEKDPNGHYMLYMAREYVIKESYKLSKVLSFLRKKWLNEEYVFSLINKSEIFDADKIGVMEMAVDGFFRENYVVFEQLCVPQLEEAIRCWFEIGGGIVLKPQSEAFYIRTLSDILEDNSALEIFDFDTIEYLKFLLVSPKGWNLRNMGAHGLRGIDNYSALTSNRIFHVLISILVNSASKRSYPN